MQLRYVIGVELIATLTIVCISVAGTLRLVCNLGVCRLDHVGLGQNCYRSLRTLAVAVCDLHQCCVLTVVRHARCQVVYDLRKLFSRCYDRTTVQCASLVRAIALEVRAACASLNLLDAVSLRLDARVVPRLLLRYAVG